jgi:hypothetical protein
MATYLAKNRVAVRLSASATRTVWLVGALLLALALYYFIGLDQGATSLFGSDMHIHEFVHDGRHFLGFPCH